LPTCCLGGCGLGSFTSFEKKSLPLTILLKKRKQKGDWHDSICCFFKKGSLQLLMKNEKEKTKG
jgi:hypothetical protein